MKRLLFTLLMLFTISITVCKSQTQCADLPESFPSYSDAIHDVESADFDYTDKLPSGKSSWIVSAHYYSCDGYVGYMIYTTNRGNEYIHANLPKRIWREFKDAESSGSYYDNNIKGKYRITIE